MLSRNLDAGSEAGGAVLRRRRKPHEHAFTEPWEGAFAVGGQIVSCIERCKCGESREWRLTDEQWRLLMAVEYNEEGNLEVRRRR